MPILLAFYNNGNIKLAIDDNDIYESFKIFYSKGSNAIDMLKDKGTSSFMTWGKKEYVSLARRNPVHFLSHSAPEFFYQDNNLFCLAHELGEYINNPAFVRHFKDVINFKTKRFYKERLEKKLDHNKVVEM